MPSRPPQNLPPGFDEMSREEQIEYVQDLWTYIAAAEDEISVPEWHLQLLQERIATESDDDAKSWTDVKRHLQSLNSLENGESLSTEEVREQAPPRRTNK